MPAFARSRSAYATRRGGARLVISLAAAGFGICPPAHGQAPPPADHEVPLGSRIPVPLPTPDERERASLRASARILQAFAHCAVERNARLFAAIVAVPPVPVDNQARNALFARARSTMSFCLTRESQMTAGQSVMIGAFAEQLYRRRFSSLPALGAANVPAADDPDSIPVRATLEFADCLIDRHAGGTDALVRTTVASDEEQAAFEALSVQYGNCLDTGSSLTLNRVVLRSALADQLYRRALAAAGGS
jgi:hypothetical protein